MSCYYWTSGKYTVVRLLQASYDPHHGGESVWLGLAMKVGYHDLQHDLLPHQG